MTDARGRRLKVHKVCLPKCPCALAKRFAIDAAEGSCSRGRRARCALPLLKFPHCKRRRHRAAVRDENDAAALGTAFAPSWTKKWWG